MLLKNKEPLLKTNKKSKLQIEKKPKKRKTDNKLFFWPKNKNNKN